MPRGSSDDRGRDPKTQEEPEALRVRPKPIVHLLFLVPFLIPALILVAFAKMTTLNATFAAVAVLLGVLLMVLSVRSGVLATRQTLTVRDMIRKRSADWAQIVEVVEDKSFGMVAVKTDDSRLHLVPYSVFRGPEEVHQLTLEFNDLRRRVSETKS